MNFSLKPHPLIAHWVPGVVVVATALLAWSNWSVPDVLIVFAGDASKAAVSVLVLSVFAFVVGEILDSCRDCWEDEINWDFFFDEPNNEKVKRLDEYYFTYYVLNKNLASAITLAWIIFMLHPPELAGFRLSFWKLLSNTQIAWLCGSTSWLALLIVTILTAFAVWILRRDASALKREIKTHTKKQGET